MDMPAPRTVPGRHHPVVIGDDSIDIEVAFSGGVALTRQNGLEAFADVLVDGFDDGAVAIVDGFAVGEQQVEEPRGNAALLETGVGVGGELRMSRDYGLHEDSLNLDGLQIFVIPVAAELHFSAALDSRFRGNDDG